ncbi:MAG: ComEC/Rec2 family competence protein [Pyrinomonadaceae bacterium]
MSDRTDGQFSRNPVLWLAVCFASGIVVGKYAAFDIRLPVAVCVVSALLALAFHSRAGSTVFIFVAFAAAGSLFYQMDANAIRADRLKLLYDNATFASGSAVEIEGILHGSPEATTEGEIITLEANAVRYRGSDMSVSGKVRVFVLPGRNSTASDGDLKSEISNLRSEIPDTEADLVSTAVPNADISILNSRLSPLKHGSRIRVACRLEREDEFLNPGVLTRREMLDQMGIDATCSLKSSLLIEHLGEEGVFLPLAWVYDQRAKLIDEFRRNLSPTSAGVMIASLLGNKHFLDKETADLFRDGGTFHVLVISGLHITFIGGILLLIIRQFTRNRWLQFGTTVGILWVYALAVGADVPVVRAAIMFTFVLFSYSIYRPASMLNSLGMCGLILLIWRPSDLFGASFQLTFVSVAAIVGCAFPLIEHLYAIGSWSPLASQPFPPNVPSWLKRFCEMLYWSDERHAVEAKRQIWTAKLFKQPLLGRRVSGPVQRIARYVFEGLLVSLIAQLWMLPLTIVYFHRVSVAAVLLNLWVGFWIAVESFAALGGVITGHFSDLLATGFYAVADAVNWIMVMLPWFFVDGGWASFRLPAYSEKGFLLYFVYFLPLLFLGVAVNRWKPFAIKNQAAILRLTIVGPIVVLAALLLALLVLHPFSAAAPDGRLNIDFLDVGQGDSALITFPNGKTMLIDAGGRFDYRDRGDEVEPFERDVRGIGESVVSEVLWSKGIDRIDHIFATHADSDHIQGLIDIAKNFRVGSAVFGRTPPDDPEFSSLADVLRRRGIPLEIVARGDTFELGGARVEVLSPTMSDDPNALSDNNSSIVVRITYGSRSFLLTGDIERQAERWLTENGGTLAADVVKVPHHGSRTSSTGEFVDAISAKYAIISVGRTSQFGHPHSEVLDRWRNAGANVLTTGERGMISVSTDGKDLVMNRYERD